MDGRSLLHPPFQDAARPVRLELNQQPYGGRGDRLEPKAARSLLCIHWLPIIAVTVDDFPRLRQRAPATGGGVVEPLDRNAAHLRRPLELILHPFLRPLARP